MKHAIALTLVLHLGTLYLLFLAFFLHSCKPHPQETLDQGEFQNRCVLIDISGQTRYDLIDGIKAVSRCGASAIGINALLIENLGTKNDTILAKVLEEAKVVVLAINETTDGEIIRSHQLFTENAALEGLIRFERDSEGVIRYIQMYRSIGNSVTWSFPVSLATVHNPNLGIRLLKEHPANKNFEIQLGSKKDDFPKIQLRTIASVDCSKVADKIVIFGELNEIDDVVKTTRGVLPRTVVLATIVNAIVKSAENRSE